MVIGLEVSIWTCLSVYLFVCLFMSAPTSDLVFTKVGHLFHPITGSDDVNEDRHTLVWQVLLR